jgi:hypothetical protein
VNAEEEDLVPFFRPRTMDGHGLTGIGVAPNSSVLTHHQPELILVS